MKKKWKTAIVCVFLTFLPAIYWFMPPYWLSDQVFIPPLRFIINPPQTAYSSVDHFFPTVSRYSKAYKKGPYEIIYVYKDTNAYGLRAKEEDVLWKSGWELMPENGGIIKKGNPKRLVYNMCVKSVHSKTYISFFKPASDSYEFSCAHTP